ncbi:MAG: rRNA adenine dimethyltransferase family protein, partial [Gammaproteobacteria bacterium]|nr:rRNA adenine dimethyltransferase family protein [Gammaproteobacteria bacterium]
MTDRHRARKRFGQNFLRDEAVIHQIVRAINPQPQQSLVEIGPGKGALTSGLIDSGCHLDLIELDRDLVPLLQALFGESERLHIHSADALQFDYSSLRRGEPRLRVVGNLPYNISTPLIFQLL